MTRRERSRFRRSMSAVRGAHAAGIPRERGPGAIATESAIRSCRGVLRTSGSWCAEDLSLGVHGARAFVVTGRVRICIASLGAYTRPRRILRIADNAASVFRVSRRDSYARKRIPRRSRGNSSSVRSLSHARFSRRSVRHYFQRPSRRSARASR